MITPWLSPLRATAALLMVVEQLDPSRSPRNAPSRRR